MEMTRAGRPKRRPAAGRSERYDLLALGSGGAAFAAAIRATNLGARVALVEKSAVGGTCVNTGCVPSKNLLAAAQAYQSAGHHPFAGIATSQQGVDLAAGVGMKDEVVSFLRGWKYEELAEKYGFEIIRGEGRFVGPDTVGVDEREIQAEHYLVATGASPWAPPIPGLEETGYLTSTTALELKEVPERLVVIGGNYIGLEMGQLFSRLGSKVVLVEVLDRLAPLEEPEVSWWITKVFNDEGIETVTSAKITGVEGSGDSKVVHLEDGRAFEADEVLVATGRRPNVEGLGLEAAGVELTDRGVRVDEEMRTTHPRVFAAGDVTGAPQFVYMAAAQGTLAARTRSPGPTGRWTTWRFPGSRSPSRRSPRWGSRTRRPTGGATAASAGWSSWSTSPGRSSTGTPGGHSRSSPSGGAGGSSASTSWPRTPGT